MKKEWLILGFLVLLPNLASAQIIFSEVMYDFPGTDAKHEWIEIYNNGTEFINLSQWSLRENQANHALVFISGTEFLNPGSFAVLADHAQTFLTDYPDFQGSLFNSYFSLNNDGEELSLINASGILVSTLSYDPELGADGNSHTLCLYNQSWQECLVTPGNSNVPYHLPENPELPGSSGYPLSLSVYLKEPVYARISYTHLFKISFKNKNCSQQDNVTVEYNVSGPGFSKTGVFSKKVGCSSYAGTGEFAPNSAGSYLLCGKIVHSSSEQNYSKGGICKSFLVADLETVSCDLSLSLNAEENLIYQQGQTIKFQPVLNEEIYPFSIDYWIEDLFGNIFKSKVTTSNTNQKSWKADIEETDKVLLIKAQVNPQCQDINLSDNYAEKMFIVANQDFTPNSEATDKNQPEDSFIKIIKINPEEPAFGELVKAELEIYKGNTNKYSLSAWAEKGSKAISEKTKINLNDKYRTYKIALPIQLEPNCDLKIEEGRAQIIISGLGKTAEGAVKLKGINKKLCSGPNSKSPLPSASASGTLSALGNPKLSYEILDLPSISFLGRPLEFKVRFLGDQKEHQVQVWSYLYRGSKCYSCDGGQREENLKIFYLNSGETREIPFDLIPDSDLEPGKYNLKVKIIKDSQKTEQELNAEIIFISEVQQKDSPLALDSAQNLLAEKSADGFDSAGLTPIGKELAEAASGFIVYQSSSEKAKKAALYILIIALGLLCLVLVRGK